MSAWMLTTSGCAAHCSPDTGLAMLRPFRQRVCQGMALCRICELEELCSAGVLTLTCTVAAVAASVQVLARSQMPQRSPRT